MIVNQPITDKKITVVVVGVQRGGTSMVAGVLRELGLPMGNNLGSNHEDPEFLGMTVDELLPAIENRNYKFDRWGWKMPHASQYIVELQKDLINPHVIIVFRNLLATAKSQLKHSKTDFSKAFKFSKGRLDQVASIVSELNCPLMLVDFENAAKYPDKFISEISEFIGAENDKVIINKAIEFINPDIGYQRASFESWNYEVLLKEKFSKISMEPVLAKRKLVNLSRQENELIRKGDDSRIDFIFPDPESNQANDTGAVMIELDRCGMATDIDIVIDLGNGFSENMKERVSTYKGRNFIKIGAKKIRGIRIRPSFEGIISNIRLVQLWHEVP